MTLVSTPQMQDAHELLVKKGRISQSAYEYAKRMGWKDADLIRAADHVANRRAQMHYNAQKWMYRTDRPALANPNDPTPEWRERAGGLLSSKTVGKGEVVPVKSFRLRTLIDQYEDLLGKERVAVLKRYEADASHSQRCRIANWEPSGGGSIHKFGGLGNVMKHIRLADQRHAFIQKHLSSDAKLVGKALVTGEMRKVTGQAFEPVEFAGRIFSDVNHTHRKWGLSMGALWMLSGQLAFLYAICPIEVPEVTELDSTLMED